jgi:hypothetical protein
MPQSYLPFLGLLTVWVSLPLFPAILIYWLFPQTKVAVRGPLSNLTFKSTGAFAAYMLVFAAITLFVKSIGDEISSHQKLSERQSEKQYWTVEIPVELQDADAKKIDDTNAILSYLKTLQVETTPLQYSIGTSKITLRLVPLDHGELPLITFKLSKFREENIDLSRLELAKDTKPDLYWIGVKQPITIRLQRELETQRLSVKAAPADEQYAK